MTHRRKRTLTMVCEYKKVTTNDENVQTSNDRASFDGAQNVKIRRKKKLIYCLFCWNGWLLPLLIWTRDIRTMTLNDEQYQKKNVLVLRVLFASDSKITQITFKHFHLRSIYFKLWFFQTHPTFGWYSSSAVLWIFQRWNRKQREDKWKLFFMLFRCAKIYETEVRG